MDTNEETVLKAMQDAGKPVRPGDIATATGIDSKDVSKAIKSLNNLRSNRLQIGQVLSIPMGRPSTSKPIQTAGYRVRSGDSPYIIARKHNMQLAEFLKINNLHPRSTIYPGQIVYIE